MDLIVDFPQQYSPRNRLPPRVTFADHLEMIIFDKISNESKAHVWFSSQEIQSFRYQMILMLRSLSSINMTVAQHAESNLHNTSAFMGLENYFSETTPCEITCRRRTIRRAILLEQQRQLDVSIQDPGAISSISQVLSLESRNRARIIGLLHADEI